MTPRGIEIRSARGDEIPLCHDLEVRSYPPAEAASASRFHDRWERFPEGFLVLREGGELRALLCAVKTRIEDLSVEEMKAEGGHDDDGRDLVILSVATDPAHRKRGLGGRLVDAILERARAMDVDRVRLVCKAELVAFYARHGFRHVGPSACHHGGAAWEEMEAPASRG